MIQIVKVPEIISSKEGGVRNSCVRSRFLGLAPFLRMSLDGQDLVARADELLRAVDVPDAAAEDLLNLSLALFCIGMRDKGLEVQSHALALTRDYHISCGDGPALITVLVLVTPGDLSANMPIECLLEDCGVRIHLRYVDSQADNPIGESVPDHDILICGMSESPANQETLRYLSTLLDAWPRPIINHPSKIRNVERHLASKLFNGVPGLISAEVTMVTRQDLQWAISEKSITPLELGASFPILLRPQGSHAGLQLEKVNDADELASYAARVSSDNYYACPFIDYRDSDGMYRKMRIAFIDGKSYPCHMATSDHWMVHYVNASMYENADRRQMEREFMELYPQFESLHKEALSAIGQLSGLDYFAVDCAICPDGSLLIFEIDHAMVMHNMDPQDLFPYKKKQMVKIRDAAIEMLLSRVRHFRF